MKRLNPLVVVLLVVAAIGAAASYWMATRTMVVGRAMVGVDEAPKRPTAANLLGKQVPDFEARDVNGAKVTSESLRGRPAVIAMWATWCEPCRAELPRIEREIWQKHRGEISVVAVAGDENANKVLSFNQQAKYTFTLVPDPGRRITGLFDREAPIPRVYVAGRDGVIAYQSVGYGRESLTHLTRAVDKELAR